VALSIKIPFLWAFVSLVLVVPAKAAEPAGPSADEKALAEDLKAQEDPTILKSRAWIEAEWFNNRHDSGSLEVILAGRKGWRISDRQDFAVQLEVPHLSKWAGSFDDQGLGDIRFTVGTAMHLNPTWRAAAGLELAMPTAEGDGLGNDLWRLREIAVVAWDVTPWLTISPQARHSHAIAREHGAAPLHYLELYFPATFLLPGNWSATVRYDAKLDFENDTVTHYGRLAVAKQFDRPKLGLSLSLKVPFNSPSNQYQVNFAISNYF
jgi:hypothetical protein